MSSVSFSRTVIRHFHSTALRAKEAPVAAVTGKLNELTLNFAVPHRAIVNRKEVKRVTFPGREGAMGIERNAPPIVSELRPGVVRVDHADGSIEEVFVPGGFAFKHANNTMDISSPEAVKLDSIDVEALRAANADAVKKLAGAAANSKEAVEAKVSLEVFSALGKALKVTL